jgi:hypothetical protein
MEKPDISIANLYNNLGEAYRNIDLKKALENYQKSLKIKTEVL